ncbi:hypothetical protein L204_103149 [Cryptococcus depauperatus]|nr:glycerol transporter [Cryptococcus depauperatus CBS 7855]
MSKIDGVSLKKRAQKPDIPTKMQPLVTDESILPPTSPRYAPLRSRANITDFTISIPNSKTRDGIGEEPTLSRWHTIEYKLYALAFVLVVPMLVWVPMRLSLPTHRNYLHYSYKLSRGWLFGRQVDNSDIQYRSFRNNLPSLVLLASSYLAASFAHSCFTTVQLSRIAFITAFSAFMIILLHGTSSLKIVALLALNYYVSKSPLSPAMRKVWPWVIICGNVVLLFMNERADGYRFQDLHAKFGLLDKYSGLLPRWHIGFNITMLRQVSFGLDYVWRENTNSNESPVDHRNRVRMSLPEEEYSFINYIAYCLYPPLYIAGPIMTFNDFIWQIRNPIPISAKTRLSYGIRFLFCLLTLESILHTMYVVAIKDTAAWSYDTPAELSMIGFWNLIIVWLKLLIPWRAFRFWALLDGMEPPENMVRCVANNYSTLGFWRSWHRSYNLWIVRYIYVPIGGSKNVIAATVLSFTFVALWHDLSLKLLAWGWLVSLFIVPEILARRIFTAEKYGSYSWYRHICAMGGVANILLMMTANLVGFVLGLDGTKHLLYQLTSTFSGWLFMVFASSCLFIAVQVMFEYREEEKRRGIDRRC